MNTLGDIGMISFFPMLPELYLALASVFLLVYCVYCRPRADSFLVGLGVLFLFFTAVLSGLGYVSNSSSFNGMFISDRFTCFAKCLVLVSSLITLLLSSGWLKEEGGRPFEYIVLLLLSTVGMMFMISAGDLLTLYLGLEMSSLALYILAAFDRDHTKSSEAGLKYFVLGALASGMMLFGISLVYGFAGSTGFAPLAKLFATTGAASKGVVVGVVLLVIGFCFKLAAVPFHMWSPDVYEGAPTPVAAFFTSAPKIAAMAIFTRLMLHPFGPLIGQWQQVIIFVSLASMLVGALAAIWQTNIKRLLAYSSIGHAGFMLMGLAAGNQAGVQAVLIYMALYVFMSLGAFGCVLLMRRGGKAVEDVKELAGLSRERPLMALALAAFMFSLAGIPPLAGFFGKMYVVLAAVSAGLAWLAVVGVVTSVIGCYYYIRIVKLMYFDEPARGFDKESPFALRIGVAACAVVTMAFFIVPTPLVEQAKLAAGALLP